MIAIILDPVIPDLNQVPGTGRSASPATSAGRNRFSEVAIHGSQLRSFLFSTDGRCRWHDCECPVALFACERFNGRHSVFLDRANFVAGGDAPRTATGWPCGSGLLMSWSIASSVPLHACLPNYICLQPAIDFIATWCPRVNLGHPDQVSQIHEVFTGFGSSGFTMLTSASRGVQRRVRWANSAGHPRGIDQSACGKNFHVVSHCIQGPCLKLQ